MSSSAKRKAASTNAFVNIEQLKRQFEDRVVGPLQELLGTKKEVSKVLGLINKALFEALHDSITSDAPEVMPEVQTARKPVTKQAKNAPEGLPTAVLKPAEVIAEGLVDMSVAHLYRLTGQRRFYSVKPKGKSIGRSYPSWQFSQPAADMLPEVLELLYEQGAANVNERLQRPEDELNELSAAEVLAGKTFLNQYTSSAQNRLLKQSDANRLKLVKDVLSRPNEKAAG
jgi:hypothetical protein